MMMKMVKKINLKLVLALAGIGLGLPVLGLAAESDDGLWADVAETDIAAVGERSIVPQRYRTLLLDMQTFTDVLSQAPLEGGSEPAVALSMPLPSGGFARFEVVEAPIMEPALAAKFPQFKTYQGRGLDDASATLRFSVTPKGLHGMILSVSGTVYIDPFQSDDKDHYISYAKREYGGSKALVGQEPFQCHVEGSSQVDLLRQKDQRQRELALQLPSGSQLRTYRTAIASTGEYTQFHGGTVPDALSAIVVALTRVNAIYERDVAVRMVLVGNNDEIIYTNAATDPYTNFDGFEMLFENQANLDAVIGSANYDLGHVFSTGGGGIAALESPCDSASKAQGVTGLSAPIGDPFYVDFVAHEIGHQFGGNHTFNGTQGSCSGGNRNASTAYEPGSGTTIMAYAGICGSDDIQPNSDDHFHVASLEEITNFITGNGTQGVADCSAQTATNNTPPSVDAGPDGSDVYSLPISTPFSLTGSASDADGDTLTYTWEQFDLGPAGAPNSPSGNAPLFRSFSPMSSPTRTFPQLSDIVDNTQTLGELLPTTSRDLTFRLTVRDNRADGGGIDADTISMSVDADAGPFQVTEPNSAVTLAANATPTVTWDVAATDTAPVNCANVNILLSTDGGNTFPTVLIEQTANDGSEPVSIPNMITSTARIKVECVFAAADTQLAFFDISNVNFSIGEGGGQLDIDGNGLDDALTDGLLTLRFLLNVSGDDLISDALGTGATRTTAAAVESYLSSNTEVFDIDGDGTTQATTDGQLILRFLFGFTGDSLITDAVGADATRVTAAAIESYLAGL